MVLVNWLSEQQEFLSLVKLKGIRYKSNSRPTILRLIRAMGEHWGGGGGGGEGRHEQRRGLCTKALMRDLETRLACRHRVFVRIKKTLWK